jgi:hypothetical protein
MHISILEQIKSFNHEIINIDGNDHIIINSIKYLIPKVPESFTNTDIKDTFIKGIKRYNFYKLIALPPYP